MPLDTEPYDFDAEIERLEDERQELAERAGTEAAESDDGLSAAAVQQAQQRGTQLDNYLAGLRWAREHCDADSVVLGGLTAGDDALVEDHVTDARQQGDGPDTAMGRTRMHVVAAGTVEGPWLAEDGDHLATVSNVADLHPGLVQWAEEHINSLGTVEGNGQSSFRALLVATAQQTSTETSGETTAE